LQNLKEEESHVAASSPEHTLTTYGVMGFVQLLAGRLIFLCACLSKYARADGNEFLIRRIHDSHHRSETYWPNPWTGSLPNYILPDPAARQKFDWTHLGTSKIQ
jgi:hypothetical protein